VDRDRTFSSAAAPLELAVEARAANLPALNASLSKAWEAAGLPPSEAQRFELALEEFLMNVVMHGSSGDAVRRVGMALYVSGGCVTMVLEDDGPPFDPLSLPPPDVTAGLEERRVGGYGIFLTRRMMDSVDYQRLGTHNQLRVSKHIER
jgi:serine/threonine-protein kinase RsbW